MANLEDQLSLLQGELKTYIERAAEERKNHGTALETTKTAIEAIQRQVDAIDVKMTEHYAHTTSLATDIVEVAIKESDSLQRLMRDKRGNAVIHIKGALNRQQQKTVITETTTGSIGTDTGSAVGFATTGVLPIDRTPGIVMEARYQLRVRNVLPTRPTTAAVIDFVKVSTPMAIASPVVEASVKPENSVAFTSASEKVRTIATWIPATRQVLDDFQELRGYIDGALQYAVDKDEEIEILSGDGTGEHLHGLIPQATAFSTTPLGTTWQRLDIIANAIGQIAAAAETDPTFVIVNTADWWKIRLTKDQYGHYILGDPQGGATTPQMWGLNVVASNSIAAGTFLVGSGTPAAVELRDRLETTVEISTEHSDFFTRNMVAIRCEKRVALVVKRPASFVTGTFTTSP